MKKMRKRSLVLIAALIVLAAGLRLLTRPKDGAGKTVVIEVAGETFASYPLDRDAEIAVKDLCVITVKNGEAFISETTCPGGDCARHAPIKSAGESIFCLPNRVTVRIEGESATDFII